MRNCDYYNRVEPILKIINHDVWKTYGLEAAVLSRYLEEGKPGDLGSRSRLRGLATRFRLYSLGECGDVVDQRRYILSNLGSVVP